ncbi:Zinc finger, FYVE/PHD-type [Pseudocohnilembus persalinus]|uniref:Zinc finger, FYVE/PHD-type n=1 Tax=Pseudocohnilembus persalinus TaxID=266149 RepID=A0A0V0QTL7_PSEPJ|nr:Zinc finger, FYVE/PHD-type [Pseudocohnilembus persalinus]|eukprot:KRX05737.1 Zinc finger, FYVE/PHD-type [Pseudocohnilembus persalinus]
MQIKPLKSSMTMTNSVVKYDKYHYDEQTSLTLDKQKSTNINFKVESLFKKDPKCKICTLTFDTINRQHHCRLCAESVCYYCSQKRVNEQRVCDICYLKLKNRNGQLRKQQFLDSLKSERNQKSKQLEGLINELKKLKQNLDQVIEDNLEKQQFQDQILNDLEIQIGKQTDELQQLQQQKLEYEKQYKNVQEDNLGLNAQKQKIQNELEIIDQEVHDLEGKLSNSKDIFEQLKQDKKKQEESRDFQLLPNYNKAKKFTTIPLSEAIIALDEQYPPENQYNQENEQNQQVQNNYERDKESELYKLSNHSSENQQYKQQSEIRSYDVRKKRGLCN